MVRAAAGFHHNQANRTIGEPALKLRSCQAFAPDEAPVLIGNRELEDALRKIDAHDGQRGGRIHLGLSSVER
jgi:hypothetical protein